MFGYAEAERKKLTEAERRRYGAIYCGICRALGDGRSALTRVLLSYDFVLLPLLLSDLCGVPFDERTVRCLPHPVRAHEAFFNDLVSYAADMTVLLAYEKELDDLKDDGGLAPRVLSSRLKNAADRVKADFPEVADAIGARLAEISDAEAKNVLVPDVPANAFGGLLAEVFLGAPFADSLSDDLRRDLWDFSFLLGKAIYLMDAAVDFQQDLRRGRYNPFIRSSFDHRKQTLELVLADALTSLDRLPLGTDRGIVENVLLSGIWRRFDRLYGRRGDA